MKKLLSFILILCMLCFAGCSKDKNDTPVSDGKEVETVVQSGKFEDAGHGLGAEYETVKTHYKKVYDDYMALHSGENAGEGHEDESHNHADGGHGEQFPYYSHEAKDEYIEIDIIDFRFYFDADNTDKGMVAIATDSDVFGLITGLATKQEVEAKVGKEGNTLNATEADLVFLAYPEEDMLVLRYEYEDSVLDFFFYENALVTSVIKAK